MDDFPSTSVVTIEEKQLTDSLFQAQDDLSVNRKKRNVLKRLSKDPARLGELFIYTTQKIHGHKWYLWECPFCENLEDISWKRVLPLKLFLLRHLREHTKDFASLDELIQNEWYLIEEKNGCKLSKEFRKLPKVVKEWTGNRSPLSLISEVVDGMLRNALKSTFICKICFSSIRDREGISHFGTTHPDMKCKPSFSEIYCRKKDEKKPFPHNVFAYSMTSYKVHLPRLSQLTAQAERITTEEISWSCLLSKCSKSRENLKYFPSEPLLRAHILTHLENDHQRLFSEEFFDFEWELLQRETNFPAILRFIPKTIKINDICVPKAYLLPEYGRLIPSTHRGWLSCGFCFFSTNDPLLFKHHIVTHGYEEDDEPLPRVSDCLAEGEKVIALDLELMNLLLNLKPVRSFVGDEEMYANEERLWNEEAPKDPSDGDKNQQSAAFIDTVTIFNETTKESSKHSEDCQQDVIKSNELQVSEFDGTPGQSVGNQKLESLETIESGNNLSEPISESNKTSLVEKDDHAKGQSSESGKDGQENLLIEPIVSQSMLIIDEDSIDDGRSSASEKSETISSESNDDESDIPLGILRPFKFIPYKSLNRLVEITPETLPTTQGEAFMILHKAGILARPKCDHCPKKPLMSLTEVTPFAKFQCSKLHNKPLHAQYLLNELFPVRKPSFLQDLQLVVAVTFGYNVQACQKLIGCKISEERTLVVLMEYWPLSCAPFETGPLNEKMRRAVWKSLIDANQHEKPVFTKSPKVVNEKEEIVMPPDSGTSLEKDEVSIKTELLSPMQSPNSFRTETELLDSETVKKEILSPAKSRYMDNRTDLQQKKDKFEGSPKFSPSGQPQQQNKIADLNRTFSMSLNHSFVSERQASPDLFSNDEENYADETISDGNNSIQIQIQLELDSTLMSAAQSDFFDTVLKSSWANDQPILLYFSGRRSCLLCKCNLTRSSKGPTSLDSLISHILIRHEKDADAKAFIENFEKEYTSYCPPFLIKFGLRLHCRSCSRGYSNLAKLRGHKCHTQKAKKETEGVTDPKEGELVCPIQCGSRWQWDGKRCRELYLIAHLVKNHSHSKIAYQKALDISASVQLAVIYPELSITRSFSQQINNSLSYGCANCEMAFRSLGGLESHYRMIHKDKTLIHARSGRICQRNLEIEELSPGSKSSSLASASTSGCFGDVKLIAMDSLNQDQTEKVHPEVNEWLSECEPFTKESIKRQIEEFSTPVSSKRIKRSAPNEEELDGEMATVKEHFRNRGTTSGMLLLSVPNTLFDLLPGRQVSHLNPHLDDAEPKNLSHLFDDPNFIRCTICPFIGITPIDYRRHYARSHKEDTPTSALTPGEAATRLRVCATCRKPCKTLRELSDHVKTCHTTEDLCFTCQSCPKVFKTEANLKEHAKRHLPKS